MKDVDGFDCLLSDLLVAEDQIQPVMQGPSGQGRLQRLSLNQHKQARVPFTPRGQQHVIHRFSVLSHAKVKTWKE
jgi:hypothetical protein